MLTLFLMFTQSILISDAAVIPGTHRDRSWPRV